MNRGRSGGRLGALSLLAAILIIVASVARAVALLLVVRRRAPVGGFFSDSDRAAGVFGVIGTSFAVLLAFVIFLAFESYDRARDSASREAVAVTQMFRIAGLFSPADRNELEGELVCWARAVVHDEWAAMADGRESALVEGWLLRYERTIDALPLDSDKERIALGHWFDQASQRREGRRGRIAEASPFVPAMLWLALGPGALVLVTYMCFYADRGEPALVQAVMIASVTATVVAGMLVVRFLDRPYGRESGSVEPVAMSQTLARMEDRLRGPAPCDPRGQPFTES